MNREMDSADAKMNETADFIAKHTAAGGTK